MKKFFQEMRIRLALPSPAFFVQLAKFGTWLIGVGMIILTPDIPAEMGIDLHIPQLFPPIVTKIAGYMVISGILINRVAKLTVEDTSQLPH
jgi:energy-converting hydrogenase Eha subunit G